MGLCHVILEAEKSYDLEGGQTERQKHKLFSVQRLGMCDDC